MAVNSDGSNINPVALSLLNLKLSDGTFLIPTPQTVDPTKPLVEQGFSVFTEPCHFSEDQFSTNIDYLARQNSKISVRFFLANDDQTVTFPGNGLNPAGNIPGFPESQRFRLQSILSCPLLIRSVALGSTKHESDMSARAPARRPDSVQLVGRWCCRRRNEQKQRPPQFEYSRFRQFRLRVSTNNYAKQFCLQ